MYLQNIDFCSTIFPLYKKVYEQNKVTEADLYPLIDAFRNTNITDICLNVGGQCSGSPSNVLDDLVSIYERRVENGIPVDYRDMLAPAYTVIKIHGIDPFDVWFRRIREAGMRSHISVRMNDCHCPDDKTCWLRSGFFYTARQNGWMNGDRYGYFRYTLNYMYPEVRNLYLNYIREQILRYDTDGLELDFMRECICFDYAGEDKAICVPVMNGFMREVKEIVREAEAKHGHKIEITVRLPRDIAKSYTMGFDAVTWDRESLVDRIVPSPRFHGSDSHIPVEDWKSALPNTKITACIESLISDDWGMSLNGLAPMTVETVCGHAASYLARGSDGIYTFNLFGEGLGGTKDALARDRALPRMLGSYEKVAANHLRFITVGEDYDITPVGRERWNPLPKALSAGERAEFTVVTGELPAERNVVFRIGISLGTKDDVTVKINGEPLTLTSSQTPFPETAMEKGTVCYIAPVPRRDVRYTITADACASVRISWIEIEAK